MDDLLGEDWQKPAPSKSITIAPLTASASTFASNHSSLRSSPQPQNLLPRPSSGTQPPATLSRPSSTVNGTSSSRPSTGNDSFGNLVSLKAQQKVAGAGGSLSMQERQKQLLDEKRRQDEQQAQMWDRLGSGSGVSTPEIRQPSPSPALQNDAEENILAAFSKDAPVNKASHFAPPMSSGAVSGRSTPAVVQAVQASSAKREFDVDDDDPFGLNEVRSKSNGHIEPPVPTSTSIQDQNEDDILGDLGKPVVDKPRSNKTVELEQPDNEAAASTSEGNGAQPDDRALAELVDMGFPAETAKIALSESGGDVQGAVGWLLHQAHEESRQKSRNNVSESRSPQPRQQSRPEREQQAAWMQSENRSGSGSRRQDTISPTNGELSDPAQIAQQYSAKFFKSAGALWKASQKQMAKTIAEFQQQDGGGEAGQPKWMREPAAPSEGSQAAPPPRRAAGQPPSAARGRDVTDEAAMLDAPRDRPAKPARPSAVQQPPAEVLASRQREPVEPLPQRPRTQQPRFMQQSQSQTDKRPTVKLSRHQVEEQSAEAYISPARRKRAPPPAAAPKAEPQPEPEVDLFSSAPPQPAAAPTPTSTTIKPSSAPPASSRSQLTPSQPQPSPRSIPPVSSSALATSAAHRKQGTEHFKRGDYASAHESYTLALNPLPPTHPIAMIVLSNRALTALKTGDAKAAVSDADQALEIIGPGLGQGEVIEVGDGEGGKKMSEFYGKALMRKAEGLEALEKYADAASVWRLAVAAGAGGAVSIRGRDRCEKAAAPASSQTTTIVAAPRPARNATPAPVKPAPTKSLGNSLNRPTISSASSAEAVKKLRALNAEAEKVDDEKFALADSVDARLKAWREGKTDNLRALLQSLDAVLWEGAQWKKVGMADLVVAGKVKVVYMKAIGRVHPDKIPQDATTEQRMISAAVFATLNEAWDKFKTENNL